MTKLKRYIILEVDENFIDVLSDYLTYDEVSAFMDGIGYGVEYQNGCVKIRILDQLFNILVDDAALDNPEDTNQDLSKILKYIEERANEKMVY